MADDLDERITPDDSARISVNSLEECLVRLAQGDRDPDFLDLCDAWREIIPNQLEELRTMNRPELAARVKETYDLFVDIYKGRDYLPATG